MRPAPIPIYGLTPFLACVSSLCMGNASFITARHCYSVTFVLRKKPLWEIKGKHTSLFPQVNELAILYPKISCFLNGRLNLGVSSVVTNHVFGHVKPNNIYQVHPTVA